MTKQIPKPSPKSQSNSTNITHWDVGGRGGGGVGGGEGGEKTYQIHSLLLSTLCMLKINSANIMKYFSFCILRK